MAQLLTQPAFDAAREVSCEEIYGDQLSPDGWADDVGWELSGLLGQDSSMISTSSATGRAYCATPYFGLCIYAAA